MTTLYQAQKQLHSQGGTSALLHWGRFWKKKKEEEEEPV